MLFHPYLLTDKFIYLIKIHDRRTPEGNLNCRKYTKLHKKCAQYTEKYKETKKNKKDIKHKELRLSARLQSEDGLFIRIRNVFQPHSSCADCMPTCFAVNQQVWPENGTELHMGLRNTVRPRPTGIFGERSKARKKPV